jgi:hypothetical protein
MTTERASLKSVASTVIRALREAIAGGQLRTPVDRASLVGFGIRHQLEAIESALAGHKTAACLAILDVALAEREDRRPAPELVWTGPEAPAGAARDTAVVLRALFEGARESVILAGYSFDHAEDVLAPLHGVMLRHGVDARFFVDIKQVDRGVALEGYLAQCFEGFVRANWPFGEPRPRLYYDRRALKPGPPWHSLHAKWWWTGCGRSCRARTSRSGGRSGTSRWGCSSRMRASRGTWRGSGWG